MRITLCGLVLVMTGCDQVKRAVAPTPRNTESVEKIPAPSASQRVESYRLFTDTLDRFTKDPPKEHPLNGKRVVIKVERDAFGAKTADGKTLVLEGSAGKFRRPEVVYVLSSDHGFKSGDMGFSQYIEGVPRGAVKYSAQPWSKAWLDLTPHSTDELRKDYFVQIDDAWIVTEPKD